MAGARLASIRLRAVGKLRLNARLPVTRAPGLLAALGPAGERIHSHLGSPRRIFTLSPLRLPGVPVTESVALPPIRGEASCPYLNACRPPFHRLHLSAPPVRSARPG